MQEFKSIETLYVRDPMSHALKLGEVRVEAAEAIGAWVITEKVDGMNIRAIFTLAESVLRLEVRGRTDAAILPKGVAEAVERAFSNKEAIALLWAKELAAGKTVTFYGEVIGEGIQNNPLRLAGKRFRVFDALIGERTWLDPANLITVAESIGVPLVPLLGLINRLPTTEAELDTITKGGVSQVATERVRPEGIVARPVVPLFDTWGNRVIWKLTYREFDKLRSIAASVAVHEAQERATQAKLAIEATRIDSALQTHGQCVMTDEEMAALRESVNA